MLDTSLYAMFDGISTVEKGLMLSSVSPLILPRRSKNREPRLRNITALESIYWLYEPTPVPFTFTIEGDDKADIINKYQDLAGWLLNAVEMRLYYNPDKYYLGAIEGDLDFNLITSKFGTIKFDFMCNPPCWHRARSKQAGWKPAAGTPIPEQISSATETVSRTNAGDLPEVTYAAAHPAALFFAITGTWTSLALGGSGGLVINWPSPQSMTLYIDCDTNMVYHKLAGVMTAVPYSGEFPQLAKTGAISVAGDDLAATIRLLVIERG